MSIANLDILPVAARIGAEIRGIRLSGAIDNETFEALRQALFKYKVLFFVASTMSTTSRRSPLHAAGETWSRTQPSLCARVPTSCWNSIQTMADAPIPGTLMSPLMWLTPKPQSCAQS